MSRELRRVPLTWKHPMKPGHKYLGLLAKFIPLYPPEDLAVDAANEMDEDHSLYADYAPFDGSQGYGYCSYETVSEGTPVSPVFEKPEDLIEYLMVHGDYVDQDYARTKRPWDPPLGYGPWDRKSAEALVLHGATPVGAVFIDGKCGTRRDTFGNQIKDDSDE